MTDFFDTLAKDAKTTIKSGYYSYSYQNLPNNQNHQKISLKNAIQTCKTNPIITEIKPASPSAGIIRTNIDATQLAQDMQQGGAVGISILTEPKHFHGTLTNLTQTRQATKLPLLMKDIILSPLQIDAAANLGADAILLIQALLERGYGQITIHELIEYAHAKDLEVLLETHSEAEFLRATQTQADLIGINNRDLATLKINLEVTQQILEKHKKPQKPIISESGIQTVADLQFLRSYGADAFLIGSSIMLTNDVKSKVKEFVKA
ncbi:indole-3-glycerol-phosphate synthase [Candidatus Bathycorpusculum sp.]|jgi:indole-3-glycerol phosphate synthase|uniref:indole-3-glycerol-phosphate synthase n=1 Tax=Candidatus Bathycorpusculum sp. TaxID=2994959 RepID=UPI00281A5278|nr:indole-3-glycerol-phosphate synthase [Candidatus Termitimicrobium sp.]